MHIFILTVNLQIKGHVLRSDISMCGMAERQNLFGLFQFWIIFHPDLHEMCGWGKTLDFVQPGRGEK